MPKSNVAFWQNKIRTNIERDTAIRTKLSDLGWNVLIVWECELKTKTREHVLENLYNEVTAAPGIS